MELSIYAQIINCCEGSQGDILSRQDIINAVHQKYGTNLNSVIPSDYCHNRTNKGAAEKPLFEWLGKGQYRYLGENFPYTGPVMSRPKGAQEDVTVAFWQDDIQTAVSSKSN